MGLSDNINHNNILYHISLVALFQRDITSKTIHTDTTLSTMSREGFVPPSAANLGNAASGMQSIKNYGVKYVCAQCAVNFTLSPKEPVRCKECGHRVLYKARTKRMVQFEAR